MTAKEELRRYRDKVCEVDRSIEEYELFLARATKMNAVISEMTSRTNIPSDKVGDNAVKMAELSKEYENKWMEAERTRMQLIEEINKVGGVLGKVLYDLYIKGLDLNDTAEDIHYSYERTAHLHGIALQVFERRNENANNDTSR